MKSRLFGVNLRLLLEIFLALALLLAVLTPTPTSQAAPEQAALALGWYQCNSPNIHLAVFSNRVHVYCPTTTPIAGAAPMTPGVFWFAYPTSPDSANASRVMSLMQTAVIAGQPLWLQVDPLDTSGSSFGCAASDCRRISGLEMR